MCGNVSQSFAELLNRDCQCISIDHAALERATHLLLDGSGVKLPSWAESSLFAAVPVFVSSDQIARMREVVVAVNAVVSSPQYQEIVLTRAPEIARHPVRHESVFFGFDFHLSTNGPQLIEINTNAGGPLLNFFLARAQQACCEEARRLTVAGHGAGELDREFVEMFRKEWALADLQRPLHTIAIVDDAPETQFLHPEFLLFRELFRQSGFQAFVVAPEDLRFEAGALHYAGHRIDLVYNRLVDFYLQQPNHEALRTAYLSNSAVITPHPRAHALYADKRNLIELRDVELHRQIGLSQQHSDLLVSHIPETQVVDAADAERLWSERKQWFLKPIHGYGGKAAYRGDKLTRGTFQEILRHEYVAQRVIAPSQRHVMVEGSVVPLKLDIRCFVYGTDVQLIAARLYHGQTTNFRTAGGGFAPVYTATEPV